MRIAKARDLLRDRNLPVSEVAFAVGYQSLSQFNRAFKSSRGNRQHSFGLLHLGVSDAVGTLTIPFNDAVYTGAIFTSDCVDDALLLPLPQSASTLQRPGP
jgi:hypothetical protein